MPARQIITINDPRLKQKSQPVTHFDQQIKKIVDDMFDTMYYNQGIGLAAIQVAIPKRIVVIDINDDDIKKNNRKFVMINPVITNLDPETEFAEEGCLSIFDVKLNVERHIKCDVEFQQIDSSKTKIKCDGILARCLQHEIDHLNGILITDHVSRLKKNRIINKFRKLDKKKGD